MLFGRRGCKHTIKHFKYTHTHTHTHPHIHVQTLTHTYTIHMHTYAHIRMSSLSKWRGWHCSWPQEAQGSCPSCPSYLCPRHSKSSSSQMSRGFQDPLTPLDKASLLALDSAFMSKSVLCQKARYMIYGAGPAVSQVTRWCSLCSSYLSIWVRDVSTVPRQVCVHLLGWQTPYQDR